ncbi:hypothetical protein GE061_003151 [Apolygus lucorum]|uniref:MEIOB-like N-terminal domain-containing protein n=1 Tax=Apolygus lucorum TaxID=248454 RepID=A0A8S9X2Q1_APOLU|nr:hypothetical protein GE061_003151 [Apolygus lucorum]
MRAVSGFTVRDSPADYINITVWGSALYVDNLVSTFQVGHVVDIINPKVAVRKEGSNTNFEPPVTSFLELVFNETMSEILRHDAEDSRDLLELLRLPTKPPTHFITLNDIKATGKPLNGQFVNLLVAVQKVNPPRLVNTKKGEKEVQDVEVMDQSSLSFTVSSWEQPIIEMMKTWKPRDTCMFLADIRLSWNDFKEQMIGMLTSRSIVTENPNTKEGFVLAKYASTVPIQRYAVVDALAASMTNAESITNVMSCDAVLEQATSGPQVDSFTALVYGVVESYNLDGCVPVVRIKCSICGDLIKTTCQNEECQAEPTYGLISASYDIRVTLMDHTNALENCRLKGSNASKLLGFTAEEFLQLSNEQKIELKWKYLLKKVAARAWKLVIILPHDVEDKTRSERPFQALEILRTGLSSPRDWLEPKVAQSLVDLFPLFERLPAFPPLRSSVHVALPIR